MKSYKVYYINLDKSLKRKNFMENQFKTLNIPITRFSAVYGKDASENFSQYIKEKKLSIIGENKASLHKWLNST